MAWVRFTGDFDFTPKADRRITIAYQVGDLKNVTRECAAAAKAQGKAVAADPPPRPPIQPADPASPAGGQ